MKEIIKTLKEVDNEGTRAPYWLILDPNQNMGCDIYDLSSQITGVFFSRKDATEYLKARRYNFSERAAVFCMSGHHSFLYNKLCENLNV